MRTKAATQLASTSRIARLRHQPVSTSTSMPNHYVIVTSLNHAQVGIEGGFCQANHGKKAPMTRLKKGDGIIFYSPKLDYKKPEPCQKFTGIGRVTDDAEFQVEQFPGFKPWRRKVKYDKVKKQVEIKPMLEQLDFIGDKKRWGMSVRRGFFRIEKDDFEKVEKALMQK